MGYWAGLLSCNSLSDLSLIRRKESGSRHLLGL